MTMSVLINDDEYTHSLKGLTDAYECTEGRRGSQPYTRHAAVPVYVLPRQRVASLGATVLRLRGGRFARPSPRLRFGASAANQRRVVALRLLFGCNPRPRP